MFGFFEDLLELGTCVCGLIFTFFCVGPILIAVGIVYLILASNRDRENALTAYNNVVNDWNNQYLSAFSGATFTFSPGGAASVSLGWSKSGTGYQGITDPDKDGVPQYAAAAYASAPVSTSPWRTYSLIATAPNGYTTNLTIPRGSVIEYATVTQSKSSLNCRMPSDCDSYSGSSYTGCIQKQDCYSLCSTYMGTMNGESCSYPAVLDALCIRVKDSGTGMVLDSQNSRYSDIGCFYENKFSVGIYTPLVRSKVYSTYSMADFRAGMYQIPNGVLVRESNDPYIYASWSTQGSYTFGTSTKTKLTIGISTLIAGVILTILIIFLIWCIVKSCSKKKRSTVRHAFQLLPLHLPSNRRHLLPLPY
ncbi:hypothetical protein DFJ73DRAFT_833505 [Zopfochytrium polystomum]|nr:hypothetical protein DFJ73DRAFT_833505 [Zopfochytrium polystomum]